MVCTKFAKNGKSCEREYKHRGRCGNKFCPKCGLGEKYSATGFCFTCAANYNATIFSERYKNDSEFHERHLSYCRKIPERASVMGHFYNIVKKPLPHYKGMPFYDGWNPDKGGSYFAGEDWIISNLGKRPSKGWSLDIIEHSKGFVPGNLRWADKRTQKRNQQHRFLGGITDEEFAIEAKRRGYEKIKNID